MDLWDMRKVISQAENTLRGADEVATNAASILPGRLRKVSPHVLADLKRELRDFNMKTYAWKD